MLLSKEGKHYRKRWSGFCVWVCQLTIPFWVASIFEILFLQKYSILGAAAVWTIFFLPIAILCMVLNLFHGAVLAIFAENGFWCKAETERGLFDYENQEELLYISYDSVRAIRYKAVGAYKPISKRDYSSVSVTYQYIESETGSRRETSCILRCGSTTRSARKYAYAIRKKTKNIPIKEDKADARRFVILAIIFYIFFMGIFIAEDFGLL